MNRRNVLRAGMLAGLFLSGQVHAAAHPPAAAPTFKQVWAAFKAAHLRAGQVTDSFSGVSHSEGQGYAMLFSAWAGECEAFKEIWAFTKRLQRPDGLFAWKWEGGKIVDENNATDGDIYIAWALLEGAQKFNEPGWIQEAIRILDATRLLRVSTKHGEVLLPGLAGFVEPQTAVVRVNPSYWVFPAFEAFKKFHDPDFWARQVETGQRILAYSYFGRRQLPPDWLLLSDPVSAYGAPPRFAYDAIRVPLFLIWAKKPEHPVVQRFSTFVKSPEFPAAMNLADDSAPSEKAPAFQYVAQVLERKGKFKDMPPGTVIPGDYYGKALLLLAQRALTN